MTHLDNFLQRRRIRQVAPHLQPHDIVLDIGCGPDPVLFKSAKMKLGIGVDPTLEENRIISDKFQLFKGFFPEALPTEYQNDFFDKVVALAVLEHIPEHMLRPFISACFRALKNNGSVLLTVPDQKVDSILAVLKTLRLVDGMSLEEHHGFDVSSTTGLFETAGFQRVSHRKFQLGLNNFFVFRKP